MIVLTGASGGIGNFIFKEMSKQEFVIGISNKTSLKVLKNTKIQKIDLLNNNEIIKFIKDNEIFLSKITLVHMAVVKIDKLMCNYTTDDLVKTFSVNFFANFTLTKYLLPIMIKEKWGRIINISSIAAEGSIGSTAYAASKSALVGYNKSLAKEYGRFNITSNIIRLGYFDVGLIDKLSENKVNKLIDQVPNKKLGAPDEVLKAINYIQSSNYLNGTSINLDGGL